MSDTLGTSLNVQGVQSLVENDTNKVRNGAGFEAEGLEGEPEDLLDLSLSDEELIRIADEREALYAPYEAKIRPRQQKNKKYYLGQQLQGTAYSNEDAIASNLIFEAEETFLPAALAKNPEPVVFCDNTEAGNALAGDVKTLLQYHSDALVLRQKLANVTRQWSIYFLGVMKHGWNDQIQDISTDLRKIQDFMFDPDGFVDSYGDFNSWLGERITVTAEKLAEMFPKHKEFIRLVVDDHMGSNVVYTEWWEDELCYYTFKGKVLDKHKNQFFKYEEKQMDEFGLPVRSEPRNHFSIPKKPYTFLSVFSLQEQPHDITGLIEQNIPNQNLVARRTMQVDMNLSKSNNSDIFSEDNFNQQTAKQAANARQKGNPILIPKGRPIREAMDVLPATGIADSFFKDLENNQNRLLSSFGVQGITSQQADENTTARGMILNQQYDNTRIGGGVGSRIEQFADNVFNWWVQLYHVYYDDAHIASILGQMKATEYITITNQDFNRQLFVSVAPDSMKPKDEITIMNQALQLWEQKAIDIKTLLTVLNFPDPQKTAAQAWLYQVDPMMYGKLNFPELMEELQPFMAPPAAPQMGAGGAPPPQVAGEAPETLAAEPANAALSQVPLPA